MKRAFTLIEVNLAMLIMAGGILSIIGLYSFGFRENKQSREDVAASALADAFLGPMAMALSSTNIQWSAFRDLEDYPDERGWGAYLDDQTGLVRSDPKGKAQGAITHITGLSGLKKEDYPGMDGAFNALNSAKLTCGIVIMHEQDSPVVSIGFRAVDKNKVGTLMSMPLFFTEVRFQGDPTK